MRPLVLCLGGRNLKQMRPLVN